MLLINPSFEILTPIDGLEILKSIERAGRTCYKSEDKITADSAEKFIRMIIKRGHHSVIEHESISVKFVVDRGVSHEIVRHRLAAYSQESTRYCNYKGGVTFIIPPWCSTIKQGEHSWLQVQMINGSRPDSRAEYVWMSIMATAENGYHALLKEGWPPQQARSILPNSLKTEIVMTCNLREWRHVFTLRTSPAAHPQMRELMIPLLKEFQARIPAVFEDIEVSLNP